MSSFTAEFVELPNRSKPFEDFVGKLSTKEQAEIFAAIDYLLYLKSNNLAIKENLSKLVEDGIFEIRVEIAPKIARCLYFYQKGKRIVITHGFIKKTRKTPRKEIERAKTLRNAYQEEQD